MAMIQHDVTWQGYLRRHRNDPMARVLLAMRQATPLATMRRCDWMLTTDRIDGDTYRMRINAVREHTQHWLGMDGDSEIHSLREWIPCNNGYRKARLVERD
jgi:hypothetical protein